MKEGIHPDYHPVVFVDDDWELVTRANMKSSETREIDGVDHYIIKVAISSHSHPFWTGTQRLIDEGGRLERFNNKYSRFLDNKKS